MAYKPGTDGDDSIDGTDGADTLVGGNRNVNPQNESGNDTLNGLDGDDVIAGYDGNNVMSGGDGNDTISGGKNDDYYSGNDGDDVLSAIRGGSDRFYGGEGNDRIEIGHNDFDFAEGTIDGGSGTDKLGFYFSGTKNLSVDLAITTEQDTHLGVYVITSIENVQTYDGFDTLSGNGLDNELRGMAGSDLLNGRNGNDTLDGGDGTDTATYVDAYRGVNVSLAITGAQDTKSAGIDTLIDIENLVGSAYRDVLTGNEGANRLEGGAGFDSLIGGGGNDVYILNTVSDPNRGDPPVDPTPGGAPALIALTTYDAVIESANAGTDTIYVSTLKSGYTVAANVENCFVVGTGAFSLYGNDLNNYLTANADDNTLDGRAGADTMYGGGGNDTYVVDTLQDVISEGTSGGTDTVLSSVSWILGDNFEKLTLAAGAVNGRGNGLINTIIGNDGANGLLGFDGSDTMNGGLGNDSLNGGADSDALTGADGNDKLIGEDGADRLFGGKGGDMLYGQAGADVFIYTATTDSTIVASDRDVIWDFDRTQSDRIVLQNIDANVNATGDQAFAFIGAKAFTGVAGQLRYQAGEGYLLVLGDTNGDHSADLVIRVQDLTSMIAADFVL